MSTKEAIHFSTGLTSLSIPESLVPELSIQIFVSVLRTQL